MRKLIGTGTIALLLLAGCGGDDDDAAAGVGDDAAQEQASTDDDTGTAESGSADDDTGTAESGSADDGASEGEAEEPDLEVPSGGDSAALCALAAEIDADDPFEQTTIFDGEEFFATMEDVWSRVAQVAPSQVQPDVAIITDGIDELEAILAESDFDPMQAGPKLAELDATAMSEAGARFAGYVEQECGIDIADATGGVDSTGAPSIEADDVTDLDPTGLDPNGTEAQLLTQLFNVDEETAACLIEELGTIDFDQVDASQLSQEICGTTLLEVMTGG